QTCIPRARPLARLPRRAASARSSSSCPFSRAVHRLAPERPAADDGGMQDPPRGDLSGQKRVEPDAMGAVPVPEAALYGAETARAAAWSFTRHRLPLPTVHAIAQIKAAAARVNA